MGGGNGVPSLGNGELYCRDAAFGPTTIIVGARGIGHRHRSFLAHSALRTLRVVWRLVFVWLKGLVGKSTSITRAKSCWPAFRRPCHTWALLLMYVAGCLFCIVLCFARAVVLPLFFCFFSVIFVCFLLFSFVSLAK